MSWESTSILGWAAKVSLLSEPFLYICIAPIRQGDVMCLQLLVRELPPAPLFPLWQQRVSAECTDVGGVLQGALFFTHLLWQVALITCTKKGKKIQSAAHSELHPIRGRFGSLFLNCRVWRICFSASMNLPLIKANSRFCSLSLLTDTFIVPAAHTHSLNNNTGGIFIGAYQHFLVPFGVGRMLCRRGT